MTKLPAFSKLSRAECADLLARNRFGRLAFRNKEDVDIRPISYVASDSWLFMRSAPGAKLEAIAHHPYVAFEVDEIEGPFDWRSVVAHGTIYLMHADGSPSEQRRFRRAVDALRTMVPNTLRPTDSVADRQTVFGLHVDRLDGRKAESRIRGTTAPRSPSKKRAMARRAPGRS